MQCFRGRTNVSGAELCHRPGLLSRRLPLHFDLGAQIGGDTTKTGVWVKHIGCFYDLSHVNTTLDPKWQPKKNKVQHSTGFNITKSLLKIIKYQKPPKKSHQLQHAIVSADHLRNNKPVSQKNKIKTAWLKNQRVQFP